MTTGPTSHTYFSQRIKLHYVDWGNEDAPPLLMLHGGRDHCRNWDWVAERMRHRYHIIAPDLRGHGDSAWAMGASYGYINYIYDVAQLVFQKKLAPVTIMAHSLGGSIALLYSGVFPETVKKVIAIEGMPPLPDPTDGHGEPPIEMRIRGWIEMRREGSGRVPRKYATLEDATTRMREENRHLNDEQARHLTVHGTHQNEDGTYSWKFDNLARMGGGPQNLSYDDQFRLWSCIACPVLLVRGADSWFEDPVADGRAKHVRDAHAVTVKDAGHWVHHDQLDIYMKHVWSFLDN